MSKRIEVGCDLAYMANAPTSFLFHVAVAATDHQSIDDESITVEPALALEACRVGPLGNRLHRLSVERGPVTVRYRATVTLDQKRIAGESLAESAHEELPAEVLAYLNPSRYCESDRLLKLAFDEFGQLPPGHARVSRVIDWVYEHLDYVPGSTGPSTTACDVLLARAGVCRDYAHLAITLLRALGVPARYVAGYAVDLQPPDFHGFCEAWIGDDWYLFDATRLAPVSGFVRIGAGRDAADVSFATLFGSAGSTAPVVWARDADGAARETLPEGEAVSSA